MMKQQSINRKTIFAEELRELTSSSHFVASLLLLSIFIFFAAAIMWAANAPLDEVVRGQGKIIPSSEIKKVQNFEGGILSEIMVKAGMEVKKGQPLLRLDQTQFSSKLKEHNSSYLDLIATIARLEAQLNNEKEISIPTELLHQKKNLLANQKQLLESKKKEYQSAIDVLTQEKMQKSQEYKEALENLRYKRLDLALLRKELAMIQPMVERGAASEMEALRLKRQETELIGEIEKIKITIPKLVSALKAASNMIEEEESRQKSEILAELNEARMKLESMREKTPALEDQVDRTLVRSPVNGIIKQVFVNTIGEAVSPGKDMVEIVPQEDSLLVEARILPQDIAFIHANQKAKVDITAYDSSIYGGLHGRVEHISADAILDESKKYSYYLIKVRTQSTSLKDQNSGKELPIIPGMVAEVAVLTGKKTVFDYLTKPILKTKQRALSER